MRESAAAGLPDAPAAADERLRRAGIDPDRLPILHFGLPAHLRAYPIAPWVWRIALGFALWLVFFALELAGLSLPSWMVAGTSLLIGLIILQAACDALITASERLAARKHWDHYVAGTVAEILSTLPELVVIAFVVPVSPLTAFVIALITIYNNALVFSLYSFFLPKDQRGRFLMPSAITEAGTQILIAGAAMGLILGLVMLTLSASPHPKHAFETYDLLITGVILLTIFGVYLYRLTTLYASEEREVRDTLDLSERQIERRRELVYTHVRHSSPSMIGLLFLGGVVGAFAGGERVAEFAHTAIDDLGLNSIFTALLLAVFAGMSEYVILWKAHRKREYGIALANAFGGIIQVMFLVLPFTLISIAVYQLVAGAGHPELPLEFSLSNIFLLIFLFPTFFVLDAGTDAERPALSRAIRCRSCMPGSSSRFHACDVMRARCCTAMRPLPTTWCRIAWSGR